MYVRNQMCWYSIHHKIAVIIKNGTDFRSASSSCKLTGYVNFQLVVTWKGGKSAQYSNENNLVVFKKLHVFYNRYLLMSLLNSYSLAKIIMLGKEKCKFFHIDWRYSWFCCIPINRIQIGYICIEWLNNFIPSIFELDLIWIIFLSINIVYTRRCSITLYYSLDWYKLIS